MVHLSIINPHTIFTLFARLKFFYAKSPFIGDFSSFHAPPATTNTNTATDHELLVYISSSVGDFIRYHLLKPKKNNLFLKVSLTLIIAWSLKQPTFSMKYWKVMFSPFGALVNIRREQKFQKPLQRYCNRP